MHPADAKRFYDTFQHSLRVIEGNLNTLQSDVDGLRDGQHSHTDALQHRFTQCYLHTYIHTYIHVASRYVGVTGSYYISFVGDVSHCL